MRHGGQILVDQLKRHGVARVFSVPGESFLAALDGLHDSGIDNIVCRQEGGAAMMAEAHAKLTGTPGILFVTRGPGATNASSGLHVARHDSTPMIVFVGQISSGDRDRDAFQEVDYRAFFGPLVKWVAEIDRPERLPEYCARAFAVAQSGRPGPVVLALPEDVLSASVDVPDRPPAARPERAVADAEVAVLLDRLSRAERPLVVAGGPGWSATAAADLRRFAEAFDLPVAVSFRRQDYLDNRSPSYCGDLGVGMNPALGRRLAEADLLLVLGARLGDTMTNGYSLLDPARPPAGLIHVHPDPDTVNRVYPAEHALCLPAPALLRRLAEALPPAGPGWTAWRAALRADYEAWQRPVPTPGAVRLEEVILWLSEHAPEDTIFCNGAGNYAAFLHRYLRYRGFGTQLAPTSGSMGYAVPAAVAASLQHPGRPVIGLAGDGCFQMTLNELSTAQQFGASPIYLIANNGRYGTIRMHQEKHYPGRVSGTELFNPDFAALARSYGGHGEVVTETKDFAAAYARARDAGQLAVLDLKLDADMLSTSASLSETRQAAIAT